MNVPFLVRRVQCEMCGTEVPRTHRFLIERTALNVCQNCEKFGTSLEPGVKGAKIPTGNPQLALERRRERQGTKDVFSSPSMRTELVQDFAQRIKQARESKGWTRQDLGGRVGEREVVIGRIENGSLHPPDDLAKKMERELGIKLFETVQDVVTKGTPARNLTLGDMLKDALDKKKR